MSEIMIFVGSHSECYHFNGLKDIFLQEGGGLKKFGLVRLNFALSASLPQAPKKKCFSLDNRISNYLLEPLGTPTLA